MRRWRPSKTAAKEFAETMREIETFCNVKGIQQSARGDSYYFTIGGQKYRVSNHTVAASNAGARNEFGEKVREVYHEGGEQADTIYITAGKTRIREIYSDLEKGYKLDRRGNRI